MISCAEIKLLSTLVASNKLIPDLYELQDDIKCATSKCRLYKNYQIYTYSKNAKQILFRFMTCGTGYTINFNSGVCEDDDECANGQHNCDNLGPSYFCRNIKVSCIYHFMKPLCDNNPVDLQATLARVMILGLLSM